MLAEYVATIRIITSCNKSQQVALGPPGHYYFHNNLIAKKKKKILLGNNCSKWYEQIISSDHPSHPSYGQL